MIVRFSPLFFKTLKKLNVRIRQSFKARILLFAKNPHDPRLNNHPLKREYHGLRGIDITADFQQFMKKNLKVRKNCLLYFNRNP